MGAPDAETAPRLSFGWLLTGAPVFEQPMANAMIEKNKTARAVEQCFFMGTRSLIQIRIISILHRLCTFLQYCRKNAYIVLCYQE